jgi:DNA polymerase-1
MVNSKGTDTSILYGFTKMLIDLINREKPTHIAVSFDLHDKTFRHKAYPLYKANRSAAPELVVAAMDPVSEILEAFGIPVISIPGYEADDVIGSMAAQWKRNDRKIYMVTPDKDYGQLVAENVFQYKPGKGKEDAEIIGPDEICKKYGICRPEQVIDFLTIWGDSSDNIPGIRGIGEVGAKRLMQKYGSLDKIIAGAEELPERQKKAIESSLPQIKMSKFLVTIKTDVRLPLEEEDIRFTSPDYEKIKKVFDKYEFYSLSRSLLNNVSNRGNGLITNKKIQDEGKEALTAINKKLPETAPGSLDEIQRKAAGTGEVGLFFPAPGSLVLCAGDESGYLYFYVEDLHESRSNPLLMMLLQDASIVKTGRDFKNYIKYFRKEGISLNGISETHFLRGVADIEVMHYLINPERSHSNDILFSTYLNIDRSEIEKIRNMSDGTEEKESPEVQTNDLFSGLDEEVKEKQEASNDDIRGMGIECALMIRLRSVLWQEIIKEGESDLYNNIEMPLIAVLSDMEWQGVQLDTDLLHNYGIKLSEELSQIEEKARDIADEPELNLSSPKQIGKLLFEKMKIDSKMKAGKTGNYPTDEETLRKLSDRTPVIPMILEYRGLKKLISTYTDSLQNLVDPSDGKIHTTFNQTVTSTGRLSSINPNLQNIPIRTERGKEIRKAFVPSHPNGVIVDADYSQIELRLMAQMSEDPDMIEAFIKGKDIHTATAARIFGIPEDKVTKEQRSRAKVANFGIIYGISAFGLSQRLGMSRTDSKKLIEDYFGNYPKVKEYMDRMIEKGKRDGYVETIYGRRRFLPDINSRNATVRSFNERNAINAPLQGSAADIIKAAMVNVFRRLGKENIKSKMILQVHDELVIDAFPEEADKVAELVKEETENVIKLKIPLTAECGKGNNWLEAH